MVKPKFTPDPPPNIDGLPVEQQVRMLFEHYQRQYNRIEDWWPKDLEERVQTLEQLVPYKLGPWTMVSVSSMDWDYEVVGAAECLFTTATLSSEYDYSAIQSVGSFHAIALNAAGTKLYATDQAAGSLAQGFSEFTLSTAGDPSSATHTAHHAEGGGNPGGADFPNGIYLHPDGDKVYTIDGGYDGSTQTALVGYTLSSPPSITTMEATPSDVLIVESDAPQAWGLALSRDGKHVYSGDNTGSSATVHQWDLGTAWVLSTGSYVGSIDLTTLPGFPGSTYIVRALSIDEAGTHMVVNTQGTAGVYMLTLSTPNAISSMSYTSTIVCDSTTDIYGMYIPDVCGSLIVSSPGTKEFSAYDLS